MPSAKSMLLLGALLAAGIATVTALPPTDEYCAGLTGWQACSKAINAAEDVTKCPEECVTPYTKNGGCIKYYREQDGRDTLEETRKFNKITSACNKIADNPVAAESVNATSPEPAPTPAPAPAPKPAPKPSVTAATAPSPSPKPAPKPAPTPSPKPTEDAVASSAVSSAASMLVMAGLAVVAAVLV